MGLCGKLVSLLPLLCFFTISCGTEEGTDQELPGKGRFLLPALPVQNDGSFVYVTWDRYKSQELRIKLHLLKPPGSEILHSFTYKPSVNSSVPSLEYFYISGDLWYGTVGELVPQYRFVVVTGVAFNLTSNKVYKLKLPSDLRTNQYIGAIVDSDKIEVVVTNHSICGDLSRCKLLFDSHGQQQGEPLSFPIEYKNVVSFPKVAGSMDKGTFLFGEVDGEVAGKPHNVEQIAYIGADGNATIVRFPGGSPVFRHSSMYSNTHDLYTTCKTEEPNGVTCVQYDWKSNSTAVINNITLQAQGKDTGIKGYALRVANFDKSKFLITSLECGKGSGLNCSATWVSTIDSDGKLLKATPIFDNLGCGNETTSVGSMIGDAGDQFCFYFPCYLDRPFEFSDVKSKCIAKLDL
ncbi:hypothetical protein QAD02_012273 [Eretmocerus hayati]|uniref:Uncharacterized protein n=1 Tax=Eretmocerus hayati TaxID=131215 RepID=A0ACC2P099_9HYME|nr:hypothetical protein QAD02_012273 [Eretmocerus hayati]